MITCLICLAGAGLLGSPLESATAPPSGLPPLARYEPPQFPESLRLTATGDGYAIMMFTVRSTGELDDLVAIEASHPAFVTAVGDALAKWRFEPATSTTMPRRELIQFDFRRTGMISSVSQRDATKAFFNDASQKGPALRTVHWDELEQRPERTVAVMPAYPEARRSESRQGFAKVDFVIDTSGAVRVPVVTDASDPLFGEEALKAVRQWRFAPPMYRGEQVNVRMTRTFNFGGAAPRRTPP